jgi:predicted transcriptional regulator
MKDGVMKISEIASLAAEKMNEIMVNIKIMDETLDILEKKAAEVKELDPETPDRMRDAVDELHHLIMVMNDTNNSLFLKIAVRANEVIEKLEKTA